uniref:zinc ribbon domain-containing protein n=1 Tax=Microseira wollei TaxID=467598 RepID=UPI0021F5C503|nr:zinc ribbon domain-containing protein [Microseira wollei]
MSIRFVDCPHCQTQHDRDINAAINIRNEGLRLWALGTRGSAVLGFPQVERLPCASAQGGDVSPQSSGRKKSTKSQAIPNQLGNLRCTEGQRR